MNVTEDYSQKRCFIVILAHKRTDHLVRVLHTLSKSPRVNFCSVVFSCDRPSSDVLDIIESFEHSDKHVLVHNDNPFTAAHAINRSLFRGMYFSFEEKGADYVVVVEDDILVSSDFLDFITLSFNRFSRFPAFRGINLFSRATSKADLSDCFVIGSYGLGWGWAINSNTYNRIRKFWTGEENNHWDFIFEPYCRTGFVVNSFFSRVESIGMDSTATHAHTIEAVELGKEMSLSFQQISSLKNSLRFTTDDFSWNQDYYQLKKGRFLFWLTLIGIAKFIFLLYGKSTGKSRIAVWIYACLKRTYRCIGKFSQR